MAGLYGGHHPIPIGLAGHVMGEGMRLPARGADAGRDLLGAGAVTVSQVNHRAFLGETFCGGTAEAGHRGAAGDEGDFSCEAGHRHSPDKKRGAVAETAAPRIIVSKQSAQNFTPKVAP